MVENIISNLIIDKLYGALYLDIAIKAIWKAIMKLWGIGGSAIPAIIPLLLLIILIFLIPLIPFIILIYFIIKRIRDNR